MPCCRNSYWGSSQDDTNLRCQSSRQTDKSQSKLGPTDWILKFLAFETHFTARYSFFHPLSAHISQVENYLSHLLRY